MKKVLLSLMSLLFVFSLNAQTVVFTDNFESGTSNWTLTGTWGLTTAQSYSPTNSLSESPTGNYPANALIYATMVSGANLSTFPSAELKFWTRYDIELGFDYMYIDISTDNFVTYNTIATIDGTNNTWHQKTYDLGGYCGGTNTNVKVRFRFDSDGGLELDGMYIDDFQIIGSNNDVSPPLIIHTFPKFYRGSLNDHLVVTDIVDLSGLDSVVLNYWVDDTLKAPVNGVNSAGNAWNFTIPTQAPGAWVKYVIIAVDSSSNANMATSDTGRYIAGNYIYYDNSIVDFYIRFGPTGGTQTVSGQGGAVKVSLVNTSMKTLLIRNYTDVNNPNDSMLVHIWSNNSGLPGTDLVTPFKVKAEASLTNTSPMTRIDLRPYASQLSGLQGDFFVGYTVPSGYVHSTETEPGVAGRSFLWNNNTWAGTTADFHFRVVTAADLDIAGPVITNMDIPIQYKASPGAQTIECEITDASGVDASSVYLHYKVDGVAATDIAGAATGPDKYSFTIPSQQAGAWVDYWISADDQVSVTPNTSVTDTFRYISGEYLQYDNNVIDFYGEIGGTSGIVSTAVKVTLNGTADLVTMLIRNYDGTGNSPPTPPNADMLIHVWTDVAGNPGADMITPFYATPEADTLPGKQSIFTRIDLRNYATQLSGLTGDFFIGFSVPNAMDVVNILLTQPGTFNRTFVSDGLAWYPAQGSTGAASDYHFRAISSEVSVGIEKPVSETTMLVFPNPSNGNITVALNGTGNKNVEINVVDMLGKTVYHSSRAQSPASFNTHLDLSDLTEGLYIVQVRCGDNTLVEKLIIQ